MPAGAARDHGLSTSSGGNPGFFTILAVIAGLFGLGLLLYGVYAFFTTFDAMAARCLAADNPSVHSRPDDD